MRAVSVAGDGPAAVGRWALYGSYRKVLSALLARPVLTLLGALVVIALIYAAYGRFNHGVEFFPSVEPDSAQVQVRARGDLSVYERDAIVREVERRLQGMAEVKALYARSMLTTSSQMAPDVIGVLQFQFNDWFTRRPASTICPISGNARRIFPVSNWNSVSRRWAQYG